MVEPHEKPLAALTRTATLADALAEAARSVTGEVSRENLQAWDERAGYRPV